MRYWPKLHRPLLIASFIAGLAGPTLHPMPTRLSSEVGGWLLEPLKRRFELHPVEPIESYSGVIVPGGSLERLHEAGRLARQHPHLKIYVSGAGASDDVMRLLGAGIDLDRIEIEDIAETTYENAHYAALFLKPEPAQRWLLVTSAFHMPRAMGSFRQAGFQVTPWPVDDIPPNFPRTLQVAQHEWLGLAAYWLLGRSAALFPSPADGSGSQR